MSSKPPKPSFNNTQLEPLMYPLYMTSHNDLHAAAAAAAASEPSAEASPHSFYSTRENVEDVPAGAAGAGGPGLSFAERFKRWSFEQERSIPNTDLQSYNMSPLLTVHNGHHLLSNSAAGGGGGGGASAEMREAGGHANLLGSLGCSVAESINVGFLPLSNSNTPYAEAGYASTNKPHYGTAHADMEILRVNQAHNTASGSVHLFEDIPSSLTHQSIGLSAASNYNIPYTHTTHRALPTSNFSSVNQGNNNNNNQSQLLADHHHHHQWPALRTSSAGTHPHAELLLLPGVSESVVEASPASTTHSSALSGSNKLDLLHVSSLQDKQSPMLPLGVAAGGGGRLPSATQMWHLDKLDMTVGLGLHDNPAHNSIPLPNIDHYGSARSAQSGLSLFLQSPQQRAQTALSLDAARYNARSASGSLGVLRNSKYLKAAQQLLNEFCSVCRDGNNDAKSSNMTAGSISQNINTWSLSAGLSSGPHEINVAGGDDDGQLSRAFFSINSSSAATQKGNLYQLTSNTGGAAGDKQQEDQTPTHTTPDHAAPVKQLPADERCHLQMRKARLVAMVEELDRRYQQYRDQMQLIVTSFESATGMGGAAPYTTLARRAMSRQFRGLRDAIGDHIRAVCRMLGEEVSSVPILSRGETPRLRLVDQRLRHQRSLQQIGMLPQQQAWRPQRGLPERSVSVLRAWLFEHFLHPYPKDSEKSMLARLTGLSRNQVSNWFINARVRLWKPMIEEMYIEESKALEMQEESDAMAAAAAAGECNVQNDGGGSIVLQEGEEQQESAPSRAQTAAILSWQQQAADAGAATLYNNNHNNSTPSSAAAIATNDLTSFIHYHSSARGGGPSTALHDPSSHPFSWMKPHMPAAHAGDIGILTHTHHHQQHHHHHDAAHHQNENMSNLQAAALMQGHHHLSSTATSNFMKNGVSLTLGLQQAPPHSATYNSASAATHAYHHVRPSEALLF